jgi:hypothetical protein
LWRGPPLADLAFEQFALVPVVRLEELRLVAIEARIEADLALGRHSELTAELETLVAEHPLRERLRGQLMVALYRAGRQADALVAYRDARRAFVEELGIEPGENLRQLERGILRHDASLELVAAPERSVLVLPASEQGEDALLALAEPLVRRRGRALVLTRIVATEAELREASRLALERRDALIARGVAARAAAFVSRTPAQDAVRLAVRLDTDLLLLEVPATGGGLLPEPVSEMLAGAPCDVGLLAARPRRREGAVVVPFGGGEHDWAAIEVGAWLARSHEWPLRLVGVRGRRGKRDASPLLADASLAVQYALGVAAEPALIGAGTAGLLEASQDAAVLVVGLSDRWRHQGLGDARTTLARDCPAPVVFIRGGVRPSGLVPRDGGTRYTWSVAPGSTP